MNSVQTPAATPGTAGVAALLDPERFRQWLTAQPVNATVGRACEATECPIARYLTAELPGHVFEVGLDDTDILMDEDVHYGLPGWAAEFVALIDWAHHEGEDVIAIAARSYLGQARRHWAQ